MGLEETDPKQVRPSWIMRASLVLYTLSFFLTVGVEPSRGPVCGYELFFGLAFGLLVYFFFGLVALVVNREPRLLLVLLLGLPLLANLVYWRAVLRQFKGRTGGVAAHGVVAVLLGLTALVVPIGMAFFRSRSWSLLIFYREGYWVWLVGMALLVFEGRDRGGDRLSKADAAKLAQYCDD